MIRVSKAKDGEGTTSRSSLRTAMQGLFACCSLFWVLAIVKVFVLDERRSLALIGDELVKFESNIKRSESKFMAKSFGGSVSSASSDGSAKLSSASIDYHSASASTNSKAAGGGPVVVPRASEWLYIRSLEDSGFKNSLLHLEKGKVAVSNSGNEKVKSSPTIKISTGSPKLNSNANSNSKSFTPNNPVDPSNRKPVTEFSKKPWELTWPPLRQADGSVPEEDGVEYLPLLDLPSPRFWEPESESDLMKPGRMVNGQETIFLMLASYRDFQCRETITSAFSRADYPERLFVAAVDQVVPGDIGCLDIDVPCEKDPNQPICKYRSQISVYKMDAQYATGPVEARHIGDRMYRGEHYSMQLDAHCLFVRHWDTTIIKQFKATRNDMAVLSTYLTDVQGSIDKNGDSTRDTRPIMCNSDFEGIMPARYLRHGSQPEDYPAIQGVPQLQPFWAAGFSFARGHFTVRVPYDGYQPMVFQGEEIAIGIRGFTHGYDFYAPYESVVFHEYAERSSRRTKVHMFWENSQKHAGDGIRSLKRATAIIGMARDIDPKSWDHTESDRYGLGKVRDLDLFYKIFLIDPVARKATQLCPFVKSGQMHKEFSPYLRENGQGIDYSQIQNFDTKVQIDGALKKQIPEVERILSRALVSKSKEDLDYGLFLADRCGFKEAHPDLYQEARSLFNRLKAGQ